MTRPKTNQKPALVGRSEDLERIEKVLSRTRNLLIEGPVGVGKTYLVLQVLAKVGRSFERIDGDSRYTEQKLTGWFDPPLVLKQGYRADCFIDGPLVSAMRKGEVLFINELNRMPESVQNILLPAMDERAVVLPKLGRVEAKPGFVVIATQNPREFTATHSLSEALLDRFEMLKLDYQDRDEELAIVRLHTSADSELAGRAVDIVRATRSHPSIKRGASVRAAIAIADLTVSGVRFDDACAMALPTRIELISTDEDVNEVLNALHAVEPSLIPEQKKASLKPNQDAGSKLGAVFFPPELAIQDEFDVEGGGNTSSSHDRLRKLYFDRLHRSTKNDAADREVVQLVLEQARRVVSHPNRKQTTRFSSFTNKPWAELALEETLEETYLWENPDEVLVEERVDQRFPCTVMLDCSSSMSGEKHLLGSIAVAVVLLQLPPEDASVVTFSSTTEVIKRLKENSDPAETVLRFLRRQPKGFTNIFAGLSKGFSQAKEGRFKTGLLASDGRSTEGGDPLEIAAKFENLVVLHLHGPGSDLEASKQIAQKGGGICIEVQEFEQMPRRMYDAFRWLARRAH